MGNSKSKNALTEVMTMGPCGIDPFSSYLGFDHELPRGLKFSLKFLTREQFEFCYKLCLLGQDHLFENWDAMDGKTRSVLVERLMELDEELKAVGGLKKYILTAQRLLKESNCNPDRKSMQVMCPWFKGAKLSIPPESEALSFGTPEYSELEELGLTELDQVGFCVTALETSESLIPELRPAIPKILLPAEATTKSSFLQNFIEYVKAVSKQYVKPEAYEKVLPLCIMASRKTAGPIAEYLQKNKHFGMPPSCITILCRTRGVPAFSDTDARFALDTEDPTTILLESRGHGDFHALLYESGTAKRWLKERELKWLYMVEHETNGLAFHPLPLMLGVSKNRQLLMNFLTVPRMAKDSTLGAVCALRDKKTSLYTTCNIANNELDALLRKEGYQNGEINDTSGISPFRGTTNQLLFDLRGYVSILEECRGIVPSAIFPVFVEEGEEDGPSGELETTGSTAVSDEEREEDGPSGELETSGSELETSGSTSSLPQKDGEEVETNNLLENTTSQTSEEDYPVYKFQKPVPIQSRMQDFAYLLTSSDRQDQVGFTHLSTAEMAFSPIIYSITAGVTPTLRERHELKLPPYTASSAEADLYNVGRKMLLALGCHIDAAQTTIVAGDTSVIPGPAVVLKPSIGIYFSQLQKKIPFPERIRISSRSTLVASGDGVILESFSLDGCLKIECIDGQELVVQRGDIRNKGWNLVKDPDHPNPIYRMRGYYFDRKQEERIEMFHRQRSCGLF